MRCFKYFRERQQEQGPRILYLNVINWSSVCLIGYRKLLVLSYFSEKCDKTKNFWLAFFCSVFLYYLFEEEFLFLK